MTHPLDSSTATLLPDEPARRAAFSAARDICRRHARSFYFASAFLPRRKREAAFAVYAFCRMVDDAIDLPESEMVGASVKRNHPVFSLPQVMPESSHSDSGDPGTSGHDHQANCDIGSLGHRLQLLADRLDEIYAGRLELPAVGSRSTEQHALAAFASSVREFEIPPRYFLDLAEGCRMDLTIKRYETWAELERYCYHVAGVVGLIMSCIFGLTHSDAKRQAVAMGNAMQLTNVLRDIREDLDRGRVYLPQEDLRSFGVTVGDLSACTVNDAFRELMRFEIGRARRFYQEGAEGLCWLAGDGSRLTASTMAVVYSGILDDIERRDYNVFRDRARVSFGGKLRRVPRAWRLARRAPGEPMPAFSV